MKGMGSVFLVKSRGNEDTVTEKKAELRIQKEGSNMK